MGVTAAAGVGLSQAGFSPVGASRARQRAGAGNFPETPEWNFVFINHVTTNEFWVPTIYGLEDASAMLGLPTPQWTGSETSEIGEMVNAFEAAIAAEADGIAVSLVDLEAFNDPIQQALDAGIPVLSYNADAPNARMAYVGQDLYGSGVAMGERIVEIVGEGKVALFIATPGQLNIQPRIDGALDAIAESGANIEAQDIASGPLPEEQLNVIEAWYLGNTDAVGMFAVDATQYGGHRPDRAEPERTRPGPARRRGLRPGADDSRAARPGRDRLHDRPAAVPAGLPAGACTSTSPSCPAGWFSRRRRTPVWCSSTRQAAAAVPRDLEPVRGRLRGAADRRAGRLSRQMTTPCARANRRERADGDELVRRSSEPVDASTVSRAADLISRRREASIAFVAVVLFVYFWVTTDAFFTSNNLRVVTQFTTPVAMLAIAQVMNLVGGEIDLSLGQRLRVDALRHALGAGLGTAVARGYRLRPRRGVARRARPTG